MTPARPPIYGLLAEFGDAQALVTATERAHDAGFRHMDAYSPFPIEGLSDALGFRKTRLPLIVLVGGLVGGISGYLLQYWTAVVSYPINVGGRPFHSWPAFILVTFELTILGAALSAILGMLALNGMPMPYHPVFNVPRFALATRDRFFLCIEASDALFDREKTANILRELGARVVTEVAH
jgi:Protein of unknown function (DUF3341)